MKAKDRQLRREVDEFLRASKIHHVAHAQRKTKAQSKPTSGRVRGAGPDWVIPREPGEPSVLDDPKLRAWFGNSHVVDMWGEPLAVYHGTGSTFGTFDPSKAASHSNPGCPIRGLYFGDETTARTWARGHRNGTVIKAYLRIERPLYVYGRPNCNDEDKALQGGYDGIIQQGGGEWVVFKPRQIKIIGRG